MTLDTHIPAHVRREVACEGASRWRLVLAGGTLLLETSRTGTQLVTSIVGVEPGQDADLELDAAFAA